MLPLILAAATLALIQAVQIHFTPSTVLPRDPLLPLINVPRFLEDPQTIPLFDQRFFLPSAAYKLCINLSVRNSTTDDVWILLFTQFQWTQAKTTYVPLALHHPDVKAHPYLPSSLRLLLKDGISQCWTASDLPYTRFQPLYLIVVNPNRRVLSLDGAITLVNVDERSGRESHLSMTQIPDQRTALVGSISFLLAAVLYLPTATSFAAKKTSLSTLPFLLMGNCALKSIYLGLDVLNFAWFDNYGTSSEWQRAVPRVISKLQDVTTLLLMLLIALGQYVFRSRISSIEWRFFTGVALLSCYLALFEVSVGGFQVSRYILAAVIYLCIIVAVNFNIVALTNAVNENAFDLRTADHYAHRKMYTNFRTIFVLYLIKPSSLLILSLPIVGNRDTSSLYLLTVFDLLADFLLTLALLYTFRPHRKMCLFQYLLQQQSLPSNRTAPSNLSVPSNSSEHPSNSSTQSVSSERPGAAAPRD